MPIEEEPIVGAKYENDESRSFEVTAFDEDEGTVKIEYEDGAAEEVDLDAWYEMEIKQVANPEDRDDDEDDDVEEEDEEDDEDDDYDDEDDDDYEE